MKKTKNKNIIFHYSVDYLNDHRSFSRARKDRRTNRFRYSACRVQYSRINAVDKEKKKKKGKREREKREGGEEENKSVAPDTGFLIILSDFRGSPACICAPYITTCHSALQYRIIELSGKLPLTENGSTIVVAAADATDAIVVA